MASDRRDDPERSQASEGNVKKLETASVSVALNISFLLLPRVPLPRRAVSPPGLLRLAGHTPSLFPISSLALLCPPGHAALLAVDRLGLCIQAGGEELAEPHAAQVLPQLDLEGRQAEQEGPDPAGGAQVGGFFLLLGLTPVSPSALASGAAGRVVWRPGALTLCVVSVKLRPLGERSLCCKVSAEVKRQRLLGGGFGGGAEVLRQGLGQAAGEGLQLGRVQATSPHQLADLDTAVQVQGQDPQRGHGRPGPPPPLTPVVAAGAALGVLVFGPVGRLQGVDGGGGLGEGLGAQDRAFWDSLEADLSPEDVQRTKAFDGAEVSGEGGEKHASGGGPGCGRDEGGWLDMLGLSGHRGLIPGTWGAASAPLHCRTSTALHGSSSSSFSSAPLLPAPGS